MIGWIADSLRLASGLAIWNARKTLFRASRGATACPCQTPSDSGRAMETGCEPALALNTPRRFRHVCPLLKPDAAGRLRCSVDAAQVRPFWGRAVLLTSGGLLAFYLAGASTFFLVQRSLGKPLSYRQAVWPPAWREYPQVQGRFFARKAQEAFGKKNISEALLSLSLAYQFDPNNYAAGLTLAQLWQIGQPTLSDRVYAKLAHDHPVQRAGTLAAWYHALLARGDFRSIVTLATTSLKADPGQADAWLNATIFALRHTSGPVTLQALADDPALPATARLVLALEQRTQDHTAATSRDELLLGASGATSPYFDYYRVRRLIELGFAADALAVMRQPGSRLADRDKTALWLDAQASLGWTVQARGQVAALLGTSPPAAALELLCAHLIRHPDQELLDLVAAQVRQNPTAGPATDYRVTLALLCAAGRARDLNALRDATLRAKQLSGGRFQALDAADAFFRGGGNRARIETFLPALQPLAPEVVYALLEVFYQSRPASTAPTGGRPAQP